jgi:hypothetical protein
LIFNATTWLDIAENKADAPATSLYVSLHTSDPGEAAGSGQSTNETSYTNYARVGVARTTGGWTVSGNNCSNTGAIEFPECGAVGATITHFGIGNASTGAGNLLIYGDLSTSLTVGQSVVPKFAAGALDVTAD